MGRMEITKSLENHSYSTLLSLCFRSYFPSFPETLILLNLLSSTHTQNFLSFIQIVCAPIKSRKKGVKWKGNKSNLEWTHLSSKFILYFPFLLHLICSKEFKCAKCVAKTWWLCLFFHVRNIYMVLTDVHILLPSFVYRYKYLGLFVSLFATLFLTKSILLYNFLSFNSPSFYAFPLLLAVLCHEIITRIVCNSLISLTPVQTP